MEKRREQRFPLKAPIKITCYDSDCSSAFETFSKNISSHGVCVDVDEETLHPMQRVHVELTLTIDALGKVLGSSRMVTIQVDGSVIRAVPEGVAIEFSKNYSISPVGVTG